MLYICRVHHTAKDTRITIPARLVQEFSIIPNTQFLIRAVDENTFIFRRITNENLIREEELLDEDKIINYGK